MTKSTFTQHRISVVALSNGALGAENSNGTSFVHSALRHLRDSCH